MAWITVPGSNGVWEYDNAPVEPAVGTQAHSLWALQTNGIRSVTHLGDIPVEIYASCRKVDDHSTTGELSKTFWDS